MNTHADQARRLLKRVSRFKSIEAAEVSAIVAQTHATLALVEQQRATNHILATALYHGWGKADITVPWVSLNDTARWEAVRAEIAAALGITEDS